MASSVSGKKLKAGTFQVQDSLRVKTGAWFGGTVSGPGTFVLEDYGGIRCYQISFDDMIQTAHAQMSSKGKFYLVGNQSVTDTVVLGYRFPDTVANVQLISTVRLDKPLNITEVFGSDDESYSGSPGTFNLNGNMLTLGTPNAEIALDKPLQSIGTFGGPVRLYIQPDIPGLRCFPTAYEMKPDYIMTRSGFITGFGLSAKNMKKSCDWHIFS